MLHSIHALLYITVHFNNIDQKTAVNVRYPEINKYHQVFFPETLWITLRTFILDLCDFPCSVLVSRPRLTGLHSNTHSGTSSNPFFRVTGCRSRGTCGGSWGFGGPGYEGHDVYWVCEEAVKITLNVLIHVCCTGGRVQDYRCTTWSLRAWIVPIVHNDGFKDRG